MRLLQLLLLGQHDVEPLELCALLLYSCQLLSKALWAAQALAAAGAATAATATAAGAVKGAS